MKKKIMISLLSLSLLLATACTPVETTPSGAASPAATDSSSDSSAGSASTAEGAAAPTPDASGRVSAGSRDGGADYTEGDTIKIGVSAGITGEVKLMGEYVMAGAKLAADEINASGGVLGKQIEIVFSDEGDNVQSAVTAASKLLNDPAVVGMVGPSISTYCIGSNQVVADAKKPYFASGSSANIPPMNNLWMHQQRVTDDKAGIITAKFMVETLNVKNPAILYMNDSYGVGMMEQTVKALADIGVTVDKNNLYASNVDEKQYTTFLTQIMNSDADGLLCVHHQVQAGIVMMQAKDIGIDIPLIGSNSYATEVSRVAAGPANIGWYACTDWTEDGQTGFPAEFVKAFHAANDDKVSDKSSVYAYDGVRLMCEAIRIAGTTDPAAVNDALLNDIKDFTGAMANYNSTPERSMADSLLITVNEEATVKLIERVAYN